MEDMLSDEWAERRRREIHPERAIEGEPAPGSPKGAPTENAPQINASAESRAVPREAGPTPEDTYGLTTYLAVVDGERNMVSITSSLLSAFGSGMVVEGAGYFLNNRMAYFYLDEGDPNVLAPGKRTRQTINPALALKNGKPYLVFGTPGADTQPQTQLQFFLNVVEFGMNVQQALEAPAVISTGFRTSYFPHQVEGTLRVPSSLPRHVLEELASLGHKLDVRDVRGVGSVKAILIHPQSGVLMGGVSPTGDSYVMAW
jgi:gamma-glutamyltranspeptidase/glutathione hydrolase